MKTHTYSGIARAHLDLMLSELIKNGAEIAGDNPWEIDTRQHGIKLRGHWSEATSTLSVTLAGKCWCVPSTLVWDTINGLVREIRAKSDSKIAV